MRSYWKTRDVLLDMSIKPVGAGGEVLKELDDLPRDDMMVAVHHSRVQVLVENTASAPPGRTVLRVAEVVVIIHSLEEDRF